MESYNPTLDSSKVKWTTVDQLPCRITVEDTYYIEEYAAMREHSIRTCQGFLLVYSISSRLSFDRVRYFHSQIRRLKGTQSVPICLVGNKCDLDKDTRQVMKEEGEQLAAELGIQNFFEVSAKTNVNVDEAYHAIVRTIRAIRDDESRNVASDSTDSGKASETKGKRPSIWRRLLLRGRKPKAGKIQ